MVTQKKYTFQEAKALFELPFMELLYKAHGIHRDNFIPNTIQASALASIKTGKCGEDCSYCSQSSHNGSKKVERLSKEAIIARAKQAQSLGATRFCMGASGRNPSKEELDFVCECIVAVKELGMQTCVTLGLLTKEDAERLATVGLDYYNHNIDTSPEYYNNIISTRSFQDRITTIKYVQEAGINVCSGGILGLGESNEDRIQMLYLLSNLPSPPNSIPINHLVPIEGTPMEAMKAVDPFDFVRTIGLARILMPQSYIRLSAGRSSMEETLQALCFFAGANSIFIGEELLTTKNSSIDSDRNLLQRLNIVLES